MLLAVVLHRLDRILLWSTRGRATVTSLLTALPVVVLTTTGARSRRPRSVPLVGIRVGDDMLVVASNFGARYHPAWCLNLRAEPRAIVTYRGRSVGVTAREAGPEERSRYWSLALQHYAGFEAYARRASGRQIPLVILHPLTGAGASETASSRLPFG